MTKLSEKLIAVAVVSILVFVTDDPSMIKTIIELALLLAA